MDPSHIIPMELQLASMRSIRKFAKDVKAMECNIDYLVLNAAVMGCPLWYAAPCSRMVHAIMRAAYMF